MVSFLNHKTSILSQHGLTCGAVYPLYIISFEFCRLKMSQSLEYVNTILFSSIGCVVFVLLTLAIVVIVKIVKPSLCKREFLPCTSLHSADAVVR